MYQLSHPVCVQVIVPYISLIMNACFCARGYVSSYRPYMVTCATCLDKSCEASVVPTTFQDQELS